MWLAAEQIKPSALYHLAGLLFVILTDNKNRSVVCVVVVMMLFRFCIPHSTMWENKQQMWRNTCCVHEGWRTTDDHLQSIASSYITFTHTHRLKHLVQSTHILHTRKMYSCWRVFWNENNMIQISIVKGGNALSLNHSLTHTVEQ
jgi:hypothetical protein